MPHCANQRLRYRLADHVRACRIDDQVVLLDLQRTKYLGVSGTQLSALAEHIVDWPASSPGNVGAEVGISSQSSSTEVWISRLRQQRMLADAAATTQQDPRLEDPLMTLQTDAIQPPQAPTWRDLLHLATAASVATYWLKCRDLAEIAESVRRLRQRGSISGAAVGLDELSAHVSSYLRMRPFLITAHDQCLRDSLTLVSFLAKRSIYPAWVIGVKTNPFGAHSWVQSGPVVLNDSHDHVRAYRPILVV